MNARAPDRFVNVLDKVLGHGAVALRRANTLRYASATGMTQRRRRSVWLDDAEWALVQAAAAPAGLRPSEWLRQVLCWELGMTHRPKVDDEVRTAGPGGLLPWTERHGSRGVTVGVPATPAEGGPAARARAVEVAPSAPPAVLALHDAIRAALAPDEVRLKEREGAQGYELVVEDVPWLTMGCGRTLTVHLGGFPPPGPDRERDRLIGWQIAHDRVLAGDWDTQP